MLWLLMKSYDPLDHVEVLLTLKKQAISFKRDFLSIANETVLMINGFGSPRASAIGHRHTHVGANFLLLLFRTEVMD